MVSGDTIKRSPSLDAAHLSATPSDQLWLIADGSDLRKPYAKAMPHLMKVRALDKSLVPGYRTLTVLGLTRQHRGVLYHRLFSSAPDFISEPHEVQAALSSVSQAIAPLKAQMPITWLLDSGFDDLAVWRTIWEQHEHLVCRIAHPERLVEREDGLGSMGRFHPTWPPSCTAGDRKRSYEWMSKNRPVDTQRRTCYVVR
jgi:hypothetical protein